MIWVNTWKNPKIQKKIYQIIIINQQIYLCISANFKCQWLAGWLDIVKIKQIQVQPKIGLAASFVSFINLIFWRSFLVFALLHYATNAQTSKVKTISWWGNEPLLMQAKLFKFWKIFSSIIPPFALSISTRDFHLKVSKLFTFLKQVYPTNGCETVYN